MTYWSPDGSDESVKVLLIPFCVSPDAMTARCVTAVTLMSSDVFWYLLCKHQEGEEIW